VSYCRFGDDSDVYLMRTGSGWWCCGCALADTPKQLEVSLKTRQQVLDHLDKHILRGSKVPQHAVDRLHREIEEGKD